MQQLKIFAYENAVNETKMTVRSFCLWGLHDRLCCAGASAASVVFETPLLRRRRWIGPAASDL
jgi:hypothetical protein